MFISTEKSLFGRPSFLWVNMLVAAILPILLGLILSNYFLEWRWINYPFHSMLESIGSFCALTIAVLIIILVKNSHLSVKYIVAACALISMGLLDGFHAVLHAGVSFVWLHSIASMLGGILFAAVWLPEHVWDNKQNHLIVSVTCLSLFIGILSIIFPQYLPVMVIDGQFSLWAKLINILGGIGFLVGTAYFSYIFLKSTEKSSNKVQDLENIIFANHCLLFGIAALLFELSTLWDLGWWWWHILRFIAYILVLIYFFLIFKKIGDQLRVNETQLADLNTDLEKRVLKRTRELEKANQIKSEFLATMSHEIRTPLNGVIGMASLLKDTHLSAEQREFSNTIGHSAEALLSIINDVLDYSKIESGKMMLENIEFNVINVLDEVADIFSIQFEQKSFP